MGGTAALRRVAPATAGTRRLAKSLASRSSGNGTAIARGARAAVASPGLRGFPPVIDAKVRVLILGSFPSTASLAAAQYYAHPQNQFWRILGSVLGEPLAELDYPRRLPLVLRHGVGIWDVLGACDRPGSLDSAIRNARANDFATLRALAPHLGHALFNGQTAGRFAPVFAAAGFAVAVLPSTSPAHAARSYAQKLRLWRNALRRALRASA